MKILIACDKFRGSLEGPEVAKYLSLGITEIDDDIEIITSPVADGGEGSLDVLSKAYGATPIKIQVQNALGKEIEAELGFNSESKVAVLEMASYVGLAMLDVSERNPSKTSSYGLGQAIDGAVELGAEFIIIGIGGSSTNDGGAGVLSALGYKFLDKNRDAVDPVGGNLSSIESVISPEEDPLKGVRIIIASDVNNPICGPKGASFVYAKQKGAADSELQFLDDNLRHFAELVGTKDVFEKEGYGAAGGVSLGLCELLGAELKSGSELIFEALGLEEKINEVDVVITGEGKIDHQTGHGKAITPIVETALKLNRKLFLVCGIFEEVDDQQLNQLPRFELANLANEQGLDSFSDADKLTVEIGRRIARSLK